MDPRLKHFLTCAAKALLATAIVASICAAIAPYREDLARLVEIDWSFLVLGVFCCLVYRIANAHGWWLVLRAVSQRLPIWLAIRVWLTSEACRWLPGSVWGYGSRAYQARNYGIPAISAGASLFLEVILTLAAWLMAAAAGVIVYRAEFEYLVGWKSVKVIAFGVLLLAATLVILAAVSKPVCRWGFAKFERLHEQLRSLGRVKPNARRSVEALSYYVLMNLFNGLACYFVLRSVATNSDVPVLAVVAANAVAWLVGFFTLIAPGGLVVREGALAALLSAWLPAEQAVVVAIVWRIVQIGVEVACMIPAGLHSAVGRRDAVKAIASSPNLS